MPENVGMQELERTRILIVDDLQEKLLVYRTILETPSLEIVTATSGQEALGHVLRTDFAVILLDVNMPGMDGYETAAMIRKRTRSAHTPIIFVTAYADELHALKGYAYGAVDYILSPVAPDILRTKVRVFTDLYRLTQQVRAQAAEQVDHSERMRARLSAVLDRTPDLFIQTDADGRILHINPAGLRLVAWDDQQQRPTHLSQLGVDKPLREQAMRDGTWFGEHQLTTVDGESIPVSVLLLAHADDAHRVESLSMIARDIRERRKAEQTRDRLAAIVESSDDAMLSVTLEGIITSWNAGAERLYGYPASQAIGQKVDMLIPEDRISEERSLFEELRKGRRIAPFETVRVSRDGRRIDVALTLSPLIDSDGRVYGASKVAHDITARKQNEAELVRYRTRLEDLVRERTRELQESHERLRLSDRLASIGTLAAGLGHDMGNLLLPIRARIASLEMLSLPETAREHVEAIKVAAEYLKRLSQGLRLFALDPTESSSGASTHLQTWWMDVEPFLRNALPRTTTIEADLPESLPPIAIAPHAFTQAIYNLVQNAGDAMQGQPRGRVRISAALGPGGDRVVVNVSDDGPGMTEEVRRRCMEPFFTTRKRGISTGLGLALVRGAIGHVEGTVEIESTLGVGTTFSLTLPVSRRAASGLASDQQTGAAWIEVSNLRIAAYVSAILRGMGLQVHSGPGDVVEPARLIVLDDQSPLLDSLSLILDRNSSCRVVLLGDRLTHLDSGLLVRLDPRSTPSQIREALRDALNAQDIVREGASS